MVASINILSCLIWWKCAVEIDLLLLQLFAVSDGDYVDDAVFLFCNFCLRIVSWVQCSCSFSYVIWKWRRNPHAIACNKPRDSQLVSISKHVNVNCTVHWGSKPVSTETIDINKNSSMRRYEFVHRYHGTVRISKSWSWTCQKRAFSIKRPFKVTYVGVSVEVTGDYIMTWPYL